MQAQTWCIGVELFDLSVLDSMRRFARYRGDCQVSSRFAINIVFVHVSKLEQIDEDNKGQDLARILIGIQLIFNQIWLQF